MTSVERPHVATLLLWVGIFLALTSLAFPWGMKHVDEKSSPPGGEDAYYRLTVLELRASEVDSRTGRLAAYSEGYGEDIPDHNLPGSQLLEAFGPFLVVAVAGLVVAGMGHGVRPGPRRRRVAAWLVAITASGYFAAIVVALAAMAMHAQGWHAQEVGPFIPWLGTWLGILSLVALYKAVSFSDLRPNRLADGMPSLPAPGQEGEEQPRQI